MLGPHWVGLFGGGLGGVALLGKVYHWESAERFQSPCQSQILSYCYSVLPGCLPATLMVMDPNPLDQESPVKHFLL